MASWMEERDRLVEQTRLFVAGVAAATVPARTLEAATPPTPEPQTPRAAAVPAPVPNSSPVIAQAITPATDPGPQLTAPPTMPPRLKNVAPVVSERAEIMQRVAAFQAHQTRLIREREAYYEATQSKIRNVLGNEFEPGQL